MDVSTISETRDRATESDRVAYWTDGVRREILVGVVTTHPPASNLLAR
jgi:hypothetical protein